jgi:methyl-accepting chemotaxis protein
MKIGKRLILTITAVNLIGLCLMGGLILSLSQKEITNLVDNELSNLALAGGQEIKSWLEQYMDAVRTVAQVMEQYEEFPVNERRALYNAMIQGLVEKNPKIAAASNIWEPNALDGLDAQYA